MTPTMKKYALMAAMSAMAAQNPLLFDTPSDILTRRPEPTPDWKRKKCKSCANYKGTYCSIKAHVRQQDMACEKYNKRKS